MSGPIENQQENQPRGARTGIFRRIAVLRYTRALKADTPALLTPWRGGLFAAGLLLLGAALPLLRLA